MQKQFNGSWTTGLSTGSRIALVPGNSPLQFSVLSPGVSGRTSWKGKRIWDAAEEYGQWQATTGQEGPRKGKIRIARGVGASRKEHNATFKIEWEPIQYVERQKTSRKKGTRKTGGYVATLHWVMNIRRTITFEGVQYDRVLKSWTFKQTLAFVAG
jgi:hypothetical protein